MSINEQRKGQVVIIATKILGEIKKQLEIDEAERSLGISNESLNVMFKAVEALLVSIKNDTYPPREKRYRVLSRMVMDNWPWGTELGREIGQLEDLYDSLE